MEKRDFDDIMLGGEDMRGRDSKKMLLLIIAIVVLVLAIAIIVIAMGNAKGGGNDTIVVDLATSADSQIPGGGFNNVPLDDGSGDRFDQIVRDIKNNTEPDNTPSAPVSQPEPPKATMPSKPKASTKVATATTRPSGATITSTPRRTMNRLNNGDIAENGYYLQVGAFSKTPNRAFLDNLNNYSYRIQEIMINSNVITRYLVGPYKSRDEAQRDFDRVARDIGTPVYLLVQ